MQLDRFSNIRKSIRTLFFGRESAASKHGFRTDGERPEVKPGSSTAAGKDLLSAAIHGAASGLALGSICIVSNEELADFIFAQADMALFALSALACVQTGIATALALQLGVFGQSE